MTRPEEQDPLAADRGDVLGGVWKVTRRVGTGSTSLILVTETTEHNEVLKVPRKDDSTLASVEDRGLRRSLTW
jgi:hypothetical protein